MAKDELAKEFKYIGTRPDRPDGFDKVTGRAKYGADVAAVGMLHGAVPVSYTHLTLPTNREV